MTAALITIAAVGLTLAVVGCASGASSSEFTSQSGITGTLHLKNDTVTLNR
jgi:hypothetical protein